MSLSAAELARLKAWLAAVVLSAQTRNSEMSEGFYPQERSGLKALKTVRLAGLCFWPEMPYAQLRPVSGPAESTSSGHEAGAK
jgi:hypothetical protein